MITGTVRLSDLLSHSRHGHGGGNSIAAGRGIIIGKLAAGEMPDDVWETIYSAVRHTVTETQFREFEKSIKRVKTFDGLISCVRLHLMLASPMPEPAEATFQSWMVKCAESLMVDRAAHLRELTDELNEFANGFQKAQNTAHAN